MQVDLGKHTCYLIVSGSHSYGGQTDESDYDLRGWCIPPKEWFYNFTLNFDQNDEKFPFNEYVFRNNLGVYCAQHGYRQPGERERIDHCVYHVLKFFKLCAKCNPNLIENLYVEDEDILIINEFGMKVRENRELFLSARAKHTYTGYAISQLKRINTHRRWLLNPPQQKPERKDFGLPETSVIPADQREAAEKLIDSKVRDWLLRDAELLGTTDLALFHDKLKDFVANILSSRDLVVSLQDEQKLIDVARFTAMKQIGMTENYISVLQAEKKYRTRLNEWKQYQNWKENRNPERAKLEAKFGFDVKHGMQLVRLLVMGKELLLTGKVTVKVPKADRQFFLEVRQGEWSYEQIIEYLDGQIEEFDAIYSENRYVVPYQPDYKKLGELCFDVIDRYHHDQDNAAPARPFIS